MPTITFSFQDIKSLIQEEISVDRLGTLLEQGKGEFSGYDADTDQVTVSFDDTNLPYLWSVEGIARLIRLSLGKEKGIAKLQLQQSENYTTKVDPSVKNVRPHIVTFVAKAKKPITEEQILQLIQLQEKICDSYGKKRKNIAVGIYQLKNITFPVRYTTVDPEGIAFTPLDFKKKMTPQEILEEHPKGKEFAWILEGKDKYPLLVDANNNVLSFPPIINSAETGKVDLGETDLFFDATGHDKENLNFVANLFAHALKERGFAIHTNKIEYEKESITVPYLPEKSIEVSDEIITATIGEKLSPEEINNLLLKAGYERKQTTVNIPSYRNDIMHPVDVAEDVAIAYGFSNIKPLPLSSFSRGTSLPNISLINKTRDLLVGLGYQEVYSGILSNKELLFKKMNLEEQPIIEIEQYMSEKFSVVRNWLTPMLMDTLSKNRHAEYPQLLFEQGLVTVRKNNQVKDVERVAVAHCSSTADFTTIRQVLDYLLTTFNVLYEVVETEHSSFVAGRVARVVIHKGQEEIKIAYLGELHPSVLENFGLDVPVAVLELNLSELLNMLQ